MKLAADKSTLDRHVVNLFKHKAVLAVLLHLCVPEFKGLSTDFIMENCFVGEPIIKQIPVDQNVPQDPNTPDLFSGLREDETPYNPRMEQLLSGDEKIMGQDTVDKTQQEGTVIYDIIFLAKAPKTNSMIQLILNIEIQATDKLKYWVATRGIYYCARMISAQKNRVFTGSNYQKIQKVYSIWICPLSSTKRNSITSYDIRERQIYGRGKIPKEAYDKLNTIVITMNAEGLQSENDLIRYLSLLTINRMPVEERERELERDYHIQMNAEIKKEVKEMCNYSDRIYELGQEDARKEAEKRIQEEKRKAEKQIQEEKQKTEKAEKRSKEAEKAKAATERRAVQFMHGAGMSAQKIAEALELKLSQVNKLLKQDTPTAAKT